jgi:hypothetical protein
VVGALHLEKKRKKTLGGKKPQIGWYQKKFHHIYIYIYMVKKNLIPTEKGGFGGFYFYRSRIGQKKLPKTFETGFGLLGLRAVQI